MEKEMSECTIEMWIIDILVKSSHKPLIQQHIYHVIEL